MADPQCRYELRLRSAVQDDSVIHSFIARGWGKAVKKALRYAYRRGGGILLGIECKLIYLSKAEFVSA